MSFNSLYIFLILVGLVFFSTMCNANQEFKVNGFATLAVTHESSDDLSFSRSFTKNSRSDTSVRPDSIIGLQANWTLSDRLDVFTQLVFEDTLDNDFENRIQMAFLRYKASRQWDFLIGRVNSNIYMLSDYRNVGHGYLWARPPIEFYTQAELTESIDGIGIQYKNNVLNGFLNIRTIMGDSALQGNTDSQEIRIEANDTLTFSVDWSNLNWRLFASFAKTNLRITQGDGILAVANIIRSIPSTILASRDEIADLFAADTSQSANYLSLGIKYENNKYIVQSEFSDYSSNFIGVLPHFYSGYISAGLIFGKVTPYVLGSFSQPRDENFVLPLEEITDFAGNNALVQLTALSNLVNSQLQSVRFDQKSLATGVRWDYTPTLAFKFQYEHVFLDSVGSATPIRLVNGETSRVDQDLNVFHISANWIF